MASQGLAEAGGVGTAGGALEAATLRARARMHRCSSCRATLSGRLTVIGSGGWVARAIVVFCTISGSQKPGYIAEAK